MVIESSTTMTSGTRATGRTGTVGSSSVSIASAWLIWRRTNGSTSRMTTTLPRSEEHTSELQSLMRISYAVFCLKKKINKNFHYHNYTPTSNTSTNPPDNTHPISNTR